MRFQIETRQFNNYVEKIATIPTGIPKTPEIRVAVRVIFWNDGTVDATVMPGLDYWYLQHIPLLIKALVLSILVAEAIKKDPSLTEVDTREVWRVAAPMAMDILGAVWGE